MSVANWLNSWRLLNVGLDKSATDIGEYLQMLVDAYLPPADPEQKTESVVMDVIGFLLLVLPESACAPPCVSL
jgi:hypothetical protein